MYEFIINLIYLQNDELLRRISNKKYNHEEDKNRFIQKYLKKNYSHIRVIKGNKNDIYKKMILRLKDN